MCVWGGGTRLSPPPRLDPSSPPRRGARGAAVGAAESPALPVAPAGGGRWRGAGNYLFVVSGAQRYRASEARSTHQRRERGGGAKRRREGGDSPICVNICGRPISGRLFKELPAQANEEGPHLHAAEGGNAAAPPRGCGKVAARRAETRRLGLGGEGRGGPGTRRRHGRGAALPNPARSLLPLPSRPALRRAGAGRGSALCARPVVFSPAREPRAPLQSRSPRGAPPRASPPPRSGGGRLAAPPGTAPPARPAGGAASTGMAEPRRWRRR